MRRVLTLSIGVLLAISCVGLSPAVAKSAKHKPTLTWSLPKTYVTARKSFAFSYRTTHAPAGSHLQLQRQVGTRHVWAKVANYPKGRATHAAPGVAMGRWNYRIVLMNKKGKLLKKAALRHVTSFGTIPLSKMLEYPDNSSVTIGGRTFNYVSEPNIDSFMYQTAGTRLWYETHSACRSLTFAFASSDEQGSFLDGYNITDGYTISQETRDPVSTSISPNTVVSHTTSVVPGQSWSFTLRGSYYPYINGSASCYKVQKFETD